MRLLKVELKRLRSRRLVLAVFLGLVGVAVLVGVQAFVTSMPPSGQELVERQEWFESSLQDWEENGEANFQDCLVSQAEDRDITNDPTIDYGCSNDPPVLEDFMYETSLQTEGPGLALGYSYLLVLAAVFIGISFITAEISTGAVGNWLTFEPRRTRVFFAKLAASVVGVVPIVVGSSVVLFGALVAGFGINGALGSAVPWADLVWTLVRGVALAAVGAGAGMALGTLCKHAAAAIGVLLGYMVIFETIMAASLYDSRYQFLLLQNHLHAWIWGETTFTFRDCEPNPGGEACPLLSTTITFPQSVLVLGVLSAVVAVAAWLVFRRRDVD